MGFNSGFKGLSTCHEVILRSGISTPLIFNSLLLVGERSALCFDRFIPKKEPAETNIYLFGGRPGLDVGKTKDISHNARN